MVASITLLLSLPVVVPGMLWAQTGVAVGDAAQVSDAASQPVSRDEALWQEILTLHEALVARQAGGAPPSAAALPRRRTLLERVGLYLTLYPGGPHRDEAVRLELTMLFEIAALSGGEFERLAARVRDYLHNPPSERVLHEAAYWAIFCERLKRSTATQPTSVPVTDPDASLLAAYRQYVERYPASRYMPRLATILFEQARRVGDRQTMRRLVKRLSEAFPDHAVTALLTAQLRREEAVGGAFWLRFRGVDGNWVDTREHAGRVVLIVVWAGFDAAARECAASVDAFRQAHPQVRVVGVNLDATRDQMSGACDALGIDWPQFNDGLGWANEFARTWGVRRIPGVFIVDRAGRLVGFAGDRAWEQLAAHALEN
ncbi:MAG TPA: TlpA disulfide reductase family protein [Phycisphaerae bacterium]|nr:TlpA disulfide reductase family protein [Phycisphaerae bacterium]